MSIRFVAGFAKEASALTWGGLALGAAGAGLGGYAAYKATKVEGDVGAMRHQSRAADALHGAMLFEARTGQRLNPQMRRQIGVNYMTANQAYRKRFGQGPTAGESDENDEK